MKMRNVHGKEFKVNSKKVDSLVHSLLEELGDSKDNYKGSLGAYSAAVRVLDDYRRKLQQQAIRS